MRNYNVKSFNLMNVESNLPKKKIFFLNNGKTIATNQIQTFLCKWHTPTQKYMFFSLELFWGSVYAIYNMRVGTGMFMYVM